MKLNKELHEALECSLKLYKMVDSAGNGKGFDLNEAWKYHETIKQALIKAQKQEKVLRILINNIDIELNFFNNSLYVGDYNPELSEEEFKILKEVL